MLMNVLFGEILGILVLLVFRLRALNVKYIVGFVLLFLSCVDATIASR